MAGPFWGTQATDPKRKFRWIVRFKNDDGSQLQLAAKTVKKPSFEVGSTPHKYINHTFYFPSRLVWNDVSLTMVDIGGDKDITQIINNIVNQSGYNLPVTEGACRVSITKDKAVRFFGNEFEIVQVDDQGEDVEKWRLVNPWIKTVDFGELSYDDDALVEISLTIQYDYATLNEDLRRSKATAGISQTITGG